MRAPQQMLQKPQEFGVTQGIKFGSAGDPVRAGSPAQLHQLRPPLGHKLGFGPPLRHCPFWRQARKRSGYREPTHATTRHTQRGHACSPECAMVGAACPRQTLLCDDGWRCVGHAERSARCQRVAPRWLEYLPLAGDSRANALGATVCTACRRPTLEPDPRACFMTVFVRGCDCLGSL